MAYGDLKEFSRRAVSAGLLRDQAFNIANNPRNNGYKCELASMVYRFLDKKSAAANNSGAAIKSENM